MQMNWLKSLQKEAEKAAPALPPPVRHGPPAEIFSVSCQIRQSDPATGDPGEILMGYFTFEDGMVTLVDDGGTPSGKRDSCLPTANPRDVARRLLRGAIEPVTDFNQPLPMRRVMF